MHYLVKLIQQDYELKGNGRYLKPADKYNDPSSLVVDSEKGLFFWNSKGIVGDAIDWLTKVKGMSEGEARVYLSTLDSNASFSTCTTKTGETVYEGLVESFWLNGKNNREYWYRRLLTDTTIDRFKLGFFKGSYTVPIYANNELINIQCRKDIPEKRIYLWYRGTGTVLFNSDILEIASSIIICEGIVDAILLSQYGLPAVAPMGGASNWLPEWNKKFLRINKIFLAYDNDSAGILGAKKVAENLGVYRAKILTFEDKPNKHDVVDFFRDGGTIKEFSKMLTTESKYSFQILGEKYE